MGGLRPGARFYQAMSQRLVAGFDVALVLIERPVFSDDRQQQPLRASVPVGGRAITLLEELHPYKKLGNRAAQHRFLDRLARVLPNPCTPIIIADAGFRVPSPAMLNRWAGIGWAVSAIAIS